MMRRHSLSALILLLGVNSLAYAHANDCDHNLLRLPDYVRITALNGTLMALDSINGGIAYERLGPGEELRHHFESGVVGIVLTNFRIVGFSATTGSWASYRFFGNEVPFNDGLRLSSRLALLVTTRKAVLFDSATGSWIQTTLPPFDSPLGFYVTETLALVITQRKVLGYSAGVCEDQRPRVRAWTGLDLRIREPITDIAVGDTLATLDTPQRLLVFNVASAWSWVAKNRLF
jgi:hypothetical protein